MLLELRARQPRRGDSMIPAHTGEVKGKSGKFIHGVVDVPCANLTVTGSSSDNFISGADGPFFPLFYSPYYAHHQVIAVLPVGRVPPSHDVGRAAHPYTRP